MRYREIVEAVDVAAERGKITDAQAQASDAAAAYQRKLRQTRDRANAARRKLATASRPISPTAPAAPSPG